MVLAAERRDPASMDDDPMATLRAVQQRMAAMAEVSALQNEAAANVASSMDRIDRLMNVPATAPADEEVDMWRRKIEALSSPVVASPAQVAPDVAVVAVQHGSSARSTDAPAPQVPAGASSFDRADIGIERVSPPVAPQSAAGWPLPTEPESVAGPQSSGWCSCWGGYAAVPLADAPPEAQLEALPVPPEAEAEALVTQALQRF